MKLWEHVIDRRLRRVILISDNQFGFMCGISTIEAIHLIGRLIELYRDRKKDLLMVFIDLEKAYDRVMREVLSEHLENKEVSVAYIRTIKDKYEGAQTSVRTSVDITKYFYIDIGAPSRFSFKPILFTVVIDELTREI